MYLFPLFLPHLDLQLSLSEHVISGHKALNCCDSNHLLSKQKYVSVSQISLDFA